MLLLQVTTVRSTSLIVLRFTRNDHEHFDEKEQVEGGLGQQQSQENERLPSWHIPPLLCQGWTPHTASHLYDSAITQMALSASANPVMQQDMLEQWQMQEC